MEEYINILEELRKELGLSADGNKIKQGQALENLIQKQQAEIEKKDKIIDEMAARVYLNEEEREEMEKDIYNNVNHKGFADFVKRYFEMKVRKEND